MSSLINGKYTTKEIDKMERRLDRMERTGYVPGVGDPRQLKYERLVSEYEFALRNQ